MYHLTTEESVYASQLADIRTALARLVVMTSVMPKGVEHQSSSLSKRNGGDSMQ